MRNGMTPIKLVNGGNDMACHGVVSFEGIPRFIPSFHAGHQQEREREGDSEGKKGEATAQPE